MWALISACVLLVLLAVYCDAIDLVLDLVERNRSRLRTVDTPDGISTLPSITDPSGLCPSGASTSIRTRYPGAYTHAVRILDTDRPYWPSSSSSSLRIEKEREMACRSVSPTISHTRIREIGAWRAHGRPCDRREYEKEKVEGRESRGGR